jgi:type I restriction enzyme S subunit
MPVPLPTNSERRRLGDILDASDESICAEEASLEKLWCLKSGLMSDLLTGRVRVPEEFAVAP